MRKFDYTQPFNALLTPEITGLLTEIHEYRGKQDLFIHAKPDVLNALLEVAKIQSTEASNRIEGIATSSLRLKKLLAEKTDPVNRDEKEIAGYRDVLNTIHESHEFIPVTPNVILQLHRDLYAKLPSGLGGHWKYSENVIAQTDSLGRQSVRFQPMPCADTPRAMDELCATFTSARDRNCNDHLLLLALFIHDFLCIHPFSDGNGRMSRLLTLLLLYQSRYLVGKYISLEKLIEQSKDTYYETLQSSSVGWHTGENNPASFVSYLLGIILHAYREFESRISSVSISRASKVDRIREVFETKLGKITKRDILDRCPDISASTIEKTLKSLLDSGFIRKTGIGKSTAYYKHA